MMIFTRDDYEIDPTVWLVDWNCQWCDSVLRQKSEKVDLVQNLLCRRSSDKIYSRNGELMKEKKSDRSELILIDLRWRYAGNMLLNWLWYLGNLTPRFVKLSRVKVFCFCCFLGNSALNGDFPNLSACEHSPRAARHMLFLLRISEIKREWVSWERKKPKQNFDLLSTLLALYPKPATKYSSDMLEMSCLLSCTFFFQKQI